MIWAELLHLGYNMWSDRGPDHRLAREETPKYPPRTYLRFDAPFWDELLRKMAGAGMNMVVIDLGEGVKYDSHPELAVRNSWATNRLRKELRKLRGLNLEPIPKLNFSTAHDNWLGPYSRCVSTDRYYAVCRDLIAEVIRLFDRPRFFHLGMDEERGNLPNRNYVVARQHELWWHDLHFLVGEVERMNVRAWVWSDYLWGHHEEFLKNMPKSVLQSNWYYERKFTRRSPCVREYFDLDARGYDQIPAGSNHFFPENFGLTVKYCRKHLSPEHLLGFCQTPWRPTITPYREHHLQAIAEVEKAIAGAQPKRGRPV